MTDFTSSIFHRSFRNGSLSPETWVDGDTTPYDHDHITPDVDIEDGVVHVVWHNLNSQYNGIYYRMMDQSGWGEVDRP